MGCGFSNPNYEDTIAERYNADEILKSKPKYVYLEHYKSEKIRDVYLRVVMGKIQKPCGALVLTEKEVVLNDKLIKHTMYITAE